MFSEAAPKLILTALAGACLALHSVDVNGQETYDDPAAQGPICNPPSVQELGCFTEDFSKYSLNNFGNTFTGLQSGIEFYEVDTVSTADFVTTDVYGARSLSPPCNLSAFKLPAPRP